jgi:hypothetical protein
MNLPPQNSSQNSSQTPQPKSPFGGAFGDVRGQVNGQQIQFGLANGVRQLVWLLLFAWLLGAIGLGWLVKFSLILVGLVIFLPIVGFFGLQWWLKKNLVQADCPVCGAELTGLQGAQISCNSCGEALQVSDGRLTRLVQEGTIDVTAVDVVDVSAIDVD